MAQRCSYRWITNQRQIAQQTSLARKLYFPFQCVSGFKEIHAPTDEQWDRFYAIENYHKLSQGCLVSANYGTKSDADHWVVT
jgi:fermentation-respiration switch protein FrsA (DUF1100 family)